MQFIHTTLLLPPIEVVLVQMNEFNPLDYISSLHF